MSSTKSVTILSIATVLVIGILYFGNFTKKTANTESVHAHNKKSISIDDFENEQIDKLSEDVKSEISTLKSNLSKAKGDQQKIDFFHKIADFWQDKSPAISAYYLFRSAKHENDFEIWTNLGEQFMSLYRSPENQEISENLVNFASQSFDAALKLKPNDNDLKLLAGTAYLESGTEPMKGVSLIKEVSLDDPENQQAFILLGRFSIMSGQYDKAKEHLDKVLEMNPGNTEAIFFMAITQAELGNSEKAIELLELSKKMVNNPEFDKEINEYINDLKSNKK